MSRKDDKAIRAEKMEPIAHKNNIENFTFLLSFLPSFLFSFYRSIFKSITMLFSLWNICWKVRGDPAVFTNLVMYVQCW